MGSDLILIVKTSRSLTVPGLIQPNTELPDVVPARCLYHACIII